MCDALMLLHGSNVIHRDLRPANIALTKDGKIKIGEFGLNRAVLDTRKFKKTEALYYMAPELLRGSPHSPETDVWALGATLLELCTLKTPFAGGP